jgi:hypothetical protein
MYYLGICDTKLYYIIFKITFLKEKHFVKEKYMVFWNIQEHFILNMKILKFINYSTYMCWNSFYATLIKSA